MNEFEITVDLFAGGGGASTGIEQALGVPVNIAINHDKESIEMHKANHPYTDHFEENVHDKKVHPLKVVKGRPVGLLWASPDCTHFSKAAGKRPVRKDIRGLAWVVVKWAKAVKPRIIILENVSEFKTWGPLNENSQPDKSKAGMTFNLWSNQLRGLGYEVQFRELSAADYGAPTIRKRLFMVARCDGQPIVWPEPTHGEPGNIFGLPPYRNAAECIDWSIQCPSIFLTKAEVKEQGLRCQRPLAEKSLIRIAKGLRKFVFENPKPFIIGIDQRGSNGACSWNVDQPLRTITSKNRFALITPFIAKGYTGVVGSGVNAPTPTITSRDHNMLVMPYLSKYRGTNIGNKINSPLHTITAEGLHHALVMPFLTKYHGIKSGEIRGQALNKPLRTIDTSNRFGLVTAFLTKYYGTGIGQDILGPIHTITAKDRLGLVTVQEQDYQIVDIGLRMLQPRELATGNGFPLDYILTGNKTTQTRRIGNSVPPQLAKAIVKANVKIKQINRAKVG